MRLSVRPQPTFADLELQRQGLALDATLHAIGALLDAQPGLVDLVHRDLVRDLRRPHTGREGLTAEQTLRAYVLKHVKHWDLRELRERTADGLTLRDFTRFFSAPVPTHKAFHRAFCRLRPETVRALNEAVVRAAVAQGLEDGHRLRADTTVVETHIHFPTDSGLLWDGVRVLTRLVGQLQTLLPELAVPFVNHTRRARRRRQEIARLTPTQRATQQVPKYRELITLTTQVLAAARAVAAGAVAAPGAAPLTGIQVDALATEITTYGERIDQVIAQAHRRVLPVVVWADRLKAQVRVFLDFDHAVLADNYEWLSKLQLIPFLRDVGKYFPLGAMIAKESVRSRMTRSDEGISFTEFSYQVLQAYDFMALHERHGCTPQLGGTDQWGNITAGVELVRRVREAAVYGMTLPLVTKTDGTKFGKTEGATIWLDASKTSPYEMCHFWLNTADDDVVKYLRYFRFIAGVEVQALNMATRAAPEHREAQRVLAREVTGLVHGTPAVTRQTGPNEVLGDESVLFGRFRIVRKGKKSYQAAILG